MLANDDRAFLVWLNVFREQQITTSKHIFPDVQNTLVANPFISLQYLSASRIDWEVGCREFSYDLIPESFFMVLSLFIPFDGLIITKCSPEILLSTVFRESKKLLGVIDQLLDLSLLTASWGFDMQLMCVWVNKGQGITLQRNFQFL